MAVPTYAGKPACSCLVEWLTEFHKQLGLRGITREFRVYQLIGGAAASGGTHANGGAFDIQTLPPAGIALAREMGAATWNRSAGFSTPHAHGVLNGCPHNGPAAYQIAALAAGFNGLGKGGRGGYDDGPGPRRLRTYRQGIEWARAQSGDEDMDKVLAWIDTVHKAVLGVKADVNTVHQTVIAQGKEIAAIKAELAKVRPDIDTVHKAVLRVEKKG